MWPGLLRVDQKARARLLLVMSDQSSALVLYRIPVSIPVVFLKETVLLLPIYFLEISSVNYVNISDSF
jgi:hypothetical protein